MKIAYRLPLTIAGCALAVGVAVGVFSYNNAAKELQQAAGVALTALRVRTPAAQIIIYDLMPQYMFGLGTACRRVRLFGTASHNIRNTMFHVLGWVGITLIGDLHFIILFVSEEFNASKVFSKAVEENGARQQLKS